MQVGGTSQIKVENLVTQDSYSSSHLGKSRSSKASYIDNVIGMFDVDRLEFTYSI